MAAGPEALEPNIFINSFSFGAGIVDECRALAADSSRLGPQLTAASKAVQACVQTGANAPCVFLAGWPVNELSLEELKRAYIAFGNYVGQVVDQSRDLGNNALNDVRAQEGQSRGSRSQCSMPMHTDAAGNEIKHEVNALLCVKPSLGDGQTPFACVEQVYQEIQDSHPEVLQILDRGFFYKPTGKDDVMLFAKQRVPVLRKNKAGCVESFFAEKYVDKSRLSAEESFALKVFVQAAERQEQHIEFNWRRGDALFWNNFRALHGRRQYSDPERHLLRLWVRAGIE